MNALAITVGEEVQLGRLPLHVGGRVHFGLHREAALVEGDLHDGWPGKRAGDCALCSTLLSDQQAGLCKAHPHQVTAVILGLQ